MMNVCVSCVRYVTTIGRRETRGEQGTDSSDKWDMNFRFGISGLVHTVIVFECSDFCSIRTCENRCGGLLHCNIMETCFIYVEGTLQYVLHSILEPRVL